MKKYLLYIIAIFLISSCNKSDFLDKVNFQKFLLAGSGNYENTSHTWFLDSLVINGVPKTLSVKENNIIEPMTIMVPFLIVMDILENGILKIIMN
jgi:hypothetical protein